MVFRTCNGCGSNDSLTKEKMAEYDEHHGLCPDCRENENSIMNEITHLKRVVCGQVGGYSLTIGGCWELGVVPDEVEIIDLTLPQLRKTKAALDEYGEQLREQRKKAEEATN